MALVGPDDLWDHWRLSLWFSGRPVSLCSLRHPPDLVDSTTCSLDHPLINQLKQEQVSRAAASKCCFGHQLLDRFRLPTIEQFEYPPPRFPILQQNPPCTITSLPDCPLLLEIDDLTNEGCRPLVLAEMMRKPLRNFAVSDLCAGKADVVMIWHLATVSPLAGR